MADKRQSSLFELESPDESWEIAADQDRLQADVVFNRPLDSPYSYLVPDNLRDLVRPGCRVKVPFGRGNTPTLGYCVGLHDSIPSHRKLKSLLEVCDRQPLLDAEMLALTRWIAERYLCSWGQVLECVIPAGVKRQAGTREIVCFELADAANVDPSKLPLKQRSVVEALQKSDGPMTAADLAEAARCGTSPIDSLRKKGILRAERRRTSVSEAEFVPIAKEADLKLNAEQQAGLQEILNLVQNQQHDTILLRGVTGSGKTEVYIQAIREVVSYGRQAIVLVPEISLTPQTIRRFRARFRSVAVLHSHLSDADRHWHWQEIAEGRVQVVVGARSAVFAPVPQLGLIVIDEEHETSFKQHSTPRYHAREVARERCRRANVPLILGSATPTLESLLRAQQETDRLVTLEKRVEQRPLPRVSLVDTRNDPMIMKGQAIGRALRNGIDHALREDGQVILFLNLRGFSPILWCLGCGAVRCPDCDLSLTWHRDPGLLLCHHCEHRMPAPERCPTCGKPGLRFLGSGTQRLETEVQSKFPDAKCLRMDSDSMRGHGSHDAALESFRERKVDILLGTQMIAKGLDFPNVTLVGVINADTLLHQPDLRAAERTFQLIAQVAGRTGRGEREGRVLVQTMSPDEPVIQFAARHDYPGFARYELQKRKSVSAPPFTSMARIIIRSLDEKIAADESRRVADILRATEPAVEKSVRILGPAPAPVTRLRKYFRYHLQMTSPSGESIQRLWKSVESKLKLHSDADLTIDMDPVDLR